MFWIVHLCVFSVSLDLQHVVVIYLLIARVNSTVILFIVIGFLSNFIMTHRLIPCKLSCLLTLIRIVQCPQVLLACMKSGAGAVLSNRDVCNVLNTTFRVVHQAGSKGELLQRTARHTMHELVRAVFSHLPSLEATPALIALPSNVPEASSSNGAVYVSVCTQSCLYRSSEQVELCFSEWVIVKAQNLQRVPLLCD